MRRAVLPDAARSDEASARLAAVRRAVQALAVSAMRGDLAAIERSVMAVSAALANSTKDGTPTAREIVTAAKKSRRKAMLAELESLVKLGHGRDAPMMVARKFADDPHDDIELAKSRSKSAALATADFRTVSVCRPKVEVRINPMMKQRTIASDEIRALTRSEIARQVAALNERRAQIVTLRADIYAARVKSASPAPTINPDEAAAREHAKNLLNGSAPDWLSNAPETDRDNQLWREQRGIDIALKVLGTKEVETRAAEAVAWAEANAERWRELVREITLTAVKLKALERTAAELAGQCVDIFAVKMPLLGIVEGQQVFQTPVSELIEAALAEGVVARREIEKANSNG